MKLVRSILTSLVVSLFPIILILNFIMLVFSESNPSFVVDMERLDPTKYYFGFKSLQLLFEDLTSFEPIVSDLFEHITYYSKQWDLSPYVQTGTSGIWFNIDNPMTLFDLFTKPIILIFYPYVFLFDFFFILISPVLNCLTTFLKAITGTFNIPYPPRENYIIPDWHEIWDFTFNLRMLLR